MIAKDYITECSGFREGFRGLSPRALRAMLQSEGIRNTE